MKIGIFDPYLDDNGGGERYMMTIASSLSQDNDVFVFWDNKIDLENIRKRFELDFSKVRLTKNIFNSSLSFKDKILATKKYDALVILSDGSIPFVLSKKLFLHIQQPITSLSISSKDKLKLKRVNKIFVNSLYTKDFVDRAYNVESSLLYPPVSIFGDKSKKENIIFHVGRFRVLNVRINDYKKQQVMIDVFKDLIDHGLKNWKFVLAVSLPDTNEESFVKMKNSAKNYPIEFIVNSGKAQLWEMGSKAKIYWHASGYGENLEKDPHLAEHFGISTVEAMGVGAVPVVINAGGQKEIVKDGENGFLWKDLEEFKAKTLKLIEDDELWGKLSKKAYEDSKFYDEKNFSKNVHELIND